MFRPCFKNRTALNMASKNFRTCKVDFPITNINQPLCRSSYSYMHNNKINRPVIFLPGMLCDKRLWQYQCFQKNKVIEPFYVDLTRAKTLDDMFSEINETVKEPFSLIGFSMGGYVAQEYILRYPERVLDLVLISSFASGYTEYERQQRLKLINKVKELGIEYLTGDRLKQWLSPERSKDHELLKTLKAMATQAGSEVFIQQQLATLNRNDRRSNLGEIQCPTLIIGGLRDMSIPLSKIQDLAKAIPNSRLYTIPDSGHMIPLEKPIELDAILNDWFLERLNLDRLIQSSKNVNL
jgi:pimeloyl-ACP methyl ester carboxylesterase